MAELHPVEGLSESYARWRSRQLGRITDRLERQLLLEMLGPMAGKTALDAGCGDGAVAAELARLGANVIGLDPDAKLIATAKQGAGVEKERLRFVRGRIERLPFAAGSFDVVLAVTVLCFVPDSAQAVKEMARVLKPGGKLVIGELGYWSLWAAYRRIRGWLGHPTWRAARFRNAAELRALAEAAGLEVHDVRGAVYYPPCDAAARLFASLDLRLGRQTTFGAAFLVMMASKPGRWDGSGQPPGQILSVR
jgi:ubiquinone biosynthesis O-methyltransferase